MNIPVWPSSLPQKLLMDDYAEQDQDLTISTSVDVGPAKVRRRATAAVRPIQGQIKLTVEQLRALIAFRKNDLLGGGLRFLWRDTINPEASVEMRFVEPPSWRLVRGWYVVSLSLEILP